MKEYIKNAKRKKSEYKFYEKSNYDDGGFDFLNK
jgi:hypothetical protein